MAPGMTRKVVCPILEEISGLKAGEDVYLAVSPERVDPGNASDTVDGIPKA